MSIVGERPQTDPSAPPPSEALIEEARQRQRRQRRVGMIGALLLLAGVGSFALVASGSGNPARPAASQSVPGPSPAIVASNLGVSRAEIAACAPIAAVGGPAAGKTIRANLAFKLLKSGRFGTMPWSLWFAKPPGGSPFLSMVAGSGENMLCVESDSGGGNGGWWDAIAQLPGKPVAFVVGEVNLSSSADRYRPVSRVTMVINGHDASATRTRIGTSSYAYLFGEVSGLRCASPTDASVGLDATEVDYSGAKQIGSGTSGPPGQDTTSTGVYCGTAVSPLVSLRGDLAALPGPLRAAVLRTIDAGDVSIAQEVEHPLAARTWMTNKATYQSPDRYQGPYQPIHCGQVGGSSGPVVTVIIGSVNYQVDEHCQDGRLLQGGSEAPKVVQSAPSGKGGLTAAQVAAFGELLTALHTATSFQATAGGYSYTSDLHVFDGNDVPGEVAVTGTITVANGYVTSISSSSYWRGCEPLGPSCRFTSSTAFVERSKAPAISAPRVDSYFSGRR